MDLPEIFVSLSIEDFILLGAGLFIGLLISWLLSRPRINERDNYISELEDSIEEKDANLKDLKKNLKEQQTTLESLKTELRQGEETSNSLNEQLKEQKKYINTLEDEMADLNKQKQELTIRAEDAESRVGELEIKLQEKEHAMADLNKQKQELTIRAEDAESRLGELEIKLQEKEHEITTLTARIRVMQDDFTHISGIGPKVSSVLRLAGIKTFTQLANTNVEKIREILKAENPNLLRLTNPSSWPEQAKMAAEGDWEALSALQGSLKQKPTSSIVETMNEDSPQIITHAEPV